MTKIYICSALRGHPPYSADKLQTNLEAAKGYCRDVVAAGHLPICPPVFFSTFLDDAVPQERDWGTLLGLELLDMCDELWYWGEPSAGMANEIEYAKTHGICVGEAVE